MIDWPDVRDDASWRVLANVVLQRATFDADRAESAAWDTFMLQLLRESLDYETFTQRRLDALKVRVRRRKLEQTNLRYRYGFKDRPAHLVRSDVRKALEELQAN